MSATIRQVVDDALVIVGEVAGVGVETYGEDRMFRDAVRGFDLLFKKYAWHQYRKWYRVELDGATGIITTDAFSDIKDFEDFLAVFPDTFRKEIPVLPKGLNPYSFTTSNSSYPQFWDSLHVTHANYVGRKLQIYPVTAVGFINVLARPYPIVAPAIDWDWEDVMYLDRSLLAYATAFMTLSGDELSTAHATTVKTLMEAKFKDITSALSRHGLPISGGTPIPDQWYPYP